MPPGMLKTDRYKSKPKLWLARQLVVSHCGLVKERRHYRCSLLHILYLNAIKDIHIAIVRPCVVLNLILDELEAWKPGTIKWKVVGSTGIPLCYRGRT